MATNDIIIIGAGCVGQVLSAFLLSACADNRVFLIPSKRSYQTIKKEGIKIYGALEKKVHETNRFIVSTFIDAELIKEYTLKKSPLIFIATKAIDAITSLSSVHDVITSLSPTIVCLQNGLGSEMAVKSSVSAFDATVLKGHIFSAMYRKNGKIFSYPGSIMIEDYAPSRTLLYSIFGADPVGLFSLRLSKNMLQEIYPKLVVNCVCNPLSVIFNKNLGTLRDQYTHVIEVICDELYQLALILGLSFQSKQVLLDQVLKAMTDFSDHYSSMHYDVYNAKNSEINEINGAALELARNKALAMPLNEHLVSSIKKIESLRIACSTNSIFLNKHGEFLQKTQEDLLLIALEKHKEYLPGDNL